MLIYYIILFWLAYCETSPNILIIYFLIYLASYKWDKIEYAGNKDELPYQRYGHTAVGFGQYCIIYGGRNDINGVSEHVYTFDVGKHSELTVCILQHCHFHETAINIICVRVCLYVWWVCVHVSVCVSLSVSVCLSVCTFGPYAANRL